MKKTAFLIFVSILMGGCSWFKNNPDDPQFQRKSSALDPVGIEYHRQEAKERAEAGKYKPGEEVSVIGGKAYMFDTNPETHPGALGAIRTADKVRIIVNDGLYTKVALPDNSTAYVRDTDLRSDAEFGFDLPDEMSLFPSDDPLLGELPVVNDGAGEQVVGKDGRVHTIVRKSSVKDTPPVPGVVEKSESSSSRDAAEDRLPDPAAVQDRKKNQ